MEVREEALKAVLADSRPVVLLAMGFAAVGAAVFFSIFAKAGSLLPSYALLLAGLWAGVGIGQISFRRRVQRALGP